MMSEQPPKNLPAAMNIREGKVNFPFCTAIIILSTLGESILTLLYLINTIALHNYFAFHFLLVTSLLLLPILRPGLNFDKRLFYIALLFTAAMGLIGALTALVTLVTFCLLYFFTTKNDHLIEDILPHEKKSSGETVYERLIYGLDECDSNRFPNVFHDVLKYGTEKQKCAAIERMLRYFRIDFSPILSEALNDESASVRVLAATAVTRIDKQYADRNLELQKAAHSSPNSFQAIVDLAKQSYDYSKLDFIDKPRRKKYSLIAIENYQQAIAINPQDEESRASLVANYYALKRYQDVINCLEGTLQSMNELREESIKWYLSALFELNKFSTIRSFVDTHTFRITKPSLDYDKLLYILTMWKNREGKGEQL